MRMFVIKNDQGTYQYPRTKTDRCGIYEKTTTYGQDPGRARFFATRGAAQNSLNYNENPNYYSRRRHETPPPGLRVVEVEVDITFPED